jgi:hypothetical protein
MRRWAPVQLRNDSSITDTRRIHHSGNRFKRDVSRLKQKGATARERVLVIHGSLTEAGRTGIWDLPLPCVLWDSHRVSIKVSLILRQTLSVCTCYMNEHYTDKECSSVEVYKRFRVTHCFSFHCRNISLALLATCSLLISCLADTHWGSQYSPPKRRDISELHGVVSQKTIFFIVTAVRTANAKVQFHFYDYLSVYLILNYSV